ncbi:MAG: DHHW family protein, partial [Lachnospiraceae bacterium]
AVLAFDAAATSLGMKTGEKDFTKKTVEGTFVGRLAALCGLREPEPDVLTLYRAKKQPKAVVYDRSDGRGAGRRLAKLYDSTCLGTVDAYKYFLGGDYPLLRLTSGKAKTDRRLLIIKDSYANCILPLFSKYYAQVDVVDVHRYTGNLDALMEKDQISEVLFLCNANTLFSDTSLAGLLGGGKA